MAKSGEGTDAHATEEFIVPPAVLVWYLAVFRRMFVGMEEAGKSEDLEETWRYMWAADVVHNVPGIIRRYHTPTSFRDPTDEARWVLRFPDFLVEMGAPARHHGPAEQLVSKEGTLEELKLRDFGSAEFPPRADLERHLDWLFQFCIATRQRLPREALDEQGWLICEAYRRRNGLIGEVAKELPLGLVHWKTFDAAKFEADATRVFEELKERKS